MKILQAKFGYLIHNKVTDTYSQKIYLPNNAKLDNYEEVPREDIDLELYERVTNLQEENKTLQHNNEMLNQAKDELIQKNESLTKVAKVVANQVTDDAIALQIQEFYDEWNVDINVTVGQYIRYEGVLYKVLTAHTTQANWMPSIATSLFAKVLVDPTGTTVLEWEQPDSTNPYMTGDKVTYNGKTYICKVDNNVWQPDVYGWEVIE